MQVFLSVPTIIILVQAPSSLTWMNTPASELTSLPPPLLPQSPLHTTARGIFVHSNQMWWEHLADFKYTIQCHYLWSPCYALILQNLLILPNWSFAPLDQPQPLITIFLLSASMSLTVLASTLKWDHLVFVFLCLAWYPPGLFILSQIAGFPYFFKTE